jgi:hypothetical protein
MWIKAIPAARGVRACLAARAAGYVSEPPRYTVRVEDCTVTVLGTGQVTTTDPRRLDFHFRPATSPTPAPR